MPLTEKTKDLIARLEDMYYDVEGAVDSYQYDKFGTLVDEITVELKLKSEALTAIESAIKTIEADQRYHYPPACIQENGPLALIQMDLEGRMDVLKKIRAKLCKPTT